jgi:bifunctional non-homologous end joining protein LigD
MLPTSFPAFEPCLPTAADRPPSGHGWVHEIKHDGYRLIAHRSAAGIRLLTRNGHDFIDRYPMVVGAISKLSCWSCTIDGEVVILDQKGRAIFERLQQGPRVKPAAILFAFDLLELDGRDLRPEPLVVRKRTLQSLTMRSPAGILYNGHLGGDGAVIFRHACRLGCEGIVSKRSDSAYRSGPSRDWVKIKAPAAIEAQEIRSKNWNHR